MSKRVSTKSVVKGLRKSDATVLPAVDVVKLNFGELIDLSLGQTEDSANYGSVSFGLLRELLLAIVDRMGVRTKVALAYDSHSPPQVISAANSPVMSLHDLTTQPHKLADSFSSKLPPPATDPQETDIDKIPMKVELPLSGKDKDDAVTGSEIKKSGTVSNEIDDDSTTELEKEEVMAQSKDAKAKPRDITSSRTAHKSISDVVGDETEGQTSTIAAKHHPSKPVQPIVQERKSQDKALRSSISESGAALTDEKLSQRLAELEQTVAGLSQHAVQPYKFGSDEDNQDIESRLAVVEKGLLDMTIIIDDVINDIAMTIQKVDSLADNMEQQMKMSQQQHTTDKDAVEDAQMNDKITDETSLNKHPSSEDLKPFNLQIKRDVSEGQNEADKIAHLNENFSNIANKLNECDAKIAAMDGRMAKQKQSLSELNERLKDQLGQINNKLAHCVLWDDLERHLAKNKPLISDYFSSTSLKPSPNISDGLPTIDVGFGPADERQHAKRQGTAASTSSQDEENLQPKHTKLKDTVTGVGKDNENLHEGYPSPNVDKEFSADGKQATSPEQSDSPPMDIAGSSVSVRNEGADRSLQELKRLKEISPKLNLSQKSAEENLEEKQRVKPDANEHGVPQALEFHFALDSILGKAQSIGELLLDGAGADSLASFLPVEQLEAAEDHVLKPNRNLHKDSSLSQDKDKLYQRGSSHFVSSTDDEYDLKTDGPSENLRKTLECLADTPYKQDALGKVIDNIIMTKADNKLVESQQELNDERFIELQEKLNRQENELAAFREIVQHVSSQKVDRDYLNFALSMKCDKKDMNGLVDMKYFKRVNKILEDTIDNLRSKIKNLERESNWKATIDKVLAKVNDKADKDEVISIKKILQNFEAKLNKLSLRDFEVRTDEAAAFRKQMIPFNCLSCSKTVNMDPNKMPVSLPLEGGVSAQKSNKPYTSYELKSIREQLQDRDDIYDPYSAPRPVGGNYTMVDPLRNLRLARSTTIAEQVMTGKASALPSDVTSQPAVNVHSPIVFGNDGKIYKGAQSNKLSNMALKKKSERTTNSPEHSPTATVASAQNL